MALLLTPCHSHSYIVHTPTFFTPPPGDLPAAITNPELFSDGHYLAIRELMRAALPIRRDLTFVLEFVQTCNPQRNQRTEQWPTSGM